MSLVKERERERFKMFFMPISRLFFDNSYKIAAAIIHTPSIANSLPPKYTPFLTLSYTEYIAKSQLQPVEDYLWLS